MIQSLICRQFGQFARNARIGFFPFVSSPSQLVQIFPDGVWRLALSTIRCDLPSQGAERRAGSHRPEQKPLLRRVLSVTAWLQLLARSVDVLSSPVLAAPRPTMGGLAMESCFEQQLEQAIVARINADRYNLWFREHTKFILLD